MAEHVRIDEGVARTRTSVPRRRDPETGQVQAIPADLKPETVLKLYLTETTTSQIAKQFGVTRKSLTGWLHEVAPEQWKRVQMIRALDRKEIGNEGIDEAEDALSLARAREQVKSAQWELQALHPDYKPQLPQVTVINNNLSLDSGTVQSVSDILKTVAEKHQLSTIDNNDLPK